MWNELFIILEKLSLKEQLTVLIQFLFAFANDFFSSPFLLFLSSLFRLLSPFYLGVQETNGVPKRVGH